MARIFNLTFSARDPRHLGRFWSNAVGYHVSEDGPQLVRLHGDDGGPDLLFLQVSGVFPASGLHLDLAAHDPVAEVAARLISLGASAVDTADDRVPMPRHANGIEWFVLADPEGNEFCVGGEPRQPAKLRR